MMTGGEIGDKRELKKQNSSREEKVRDQSERRQEPSEEETTKRRKVPQKEMLSENSGQERSEEVKENSGSEDVMSSARMENVRDHGAFVAEVSEESILHQSRGKKQIQRAIQEKKKKTRLQDEPEEETSFSGSKEKIPKKKRRGRLSFEDEPVQEVRVHGSGAGFGRKSVAQTADMTTQTVTTAVHSKIREQEDDNTGVKAAHSGERLAEESTRRAFSSHLREKKARAGPDRRMEKSETSRLQFAPEPSKTVKNTGQEAEQKSAIKKWYQKIRYRRIYAAAKKEGKAAGQVVQNQKNFVAKAASVVKEVFRRNKHLLFVFGIFGLLFLLIAASMASCSAFIQGGASSIISTTYAATDEAIYQTEDAYAALEEDLNEQINSVESRHPGYDEYRYQIDEISHNPYHLISYFTVKYGEFTYEQIKSELEEIFKEQYGLSMDSETVTETKTKKVRVGQSLGSVVTSGYCPCAQCCGQWAGGPTASGVYPTASHTIAVDAYQPFVPMGTHVIMNGTEYVVEDTGAFAGYGVQFDVYYADHASAQAHGHQTWEAYLADSNGRQEVEVTTTETVKRLNVTMTNHNLDSVLRSRLEGEQEKLYDIYNMTYGNRNYLFPIDTLPSYGTGGDYTVPPEALSDERFARMYQEATKYLGVPYVWGGYSPSGFDCSGFVSYVINHCGNGWNYGRLTAEGLRSACAYVSPENARPGDLVFFEKTYNTSGASHVGIYLGDGKMIHCGKPVQIASLESQYWQEHFLQYGRLP